MHCTDDRDESLHMARTVKHTASPKHTHNEHDVCLCSAQATSSHKQFCKTASVRGTSRHLHEYSLTTTNVAKHHSHVQQLPVESSAMIRSIRCSFRPSAHSPKARH